MNPITFNRLLSSLTSSNCFVTVTAKEEEKVASASDNLACLHTSVLCLNQEAQQLSELYSRIISRTLASVCSWFYDTLCVGGVGHGRQSIFSVWIDKTLGNLFNTQLCCAVATPHTQTCCILNRVLFVINEQNCECVRFCFECPLMLLFKTFSNALVFEMSVVCCLRVHA